MRPVLIFGVNGQDGHYLSRLFEERKIKVVGVSRQGQAVNGDVASADFVDDLIKRLRPERVFHLAANSTTRHAALRENHQTISLGSLNILESVYRHCPDCRVFLTGSGVQFVNEGKPIHETDPFSASSAYSAERIYSVYLGRYYRNLGLKVFAGYLFHHESPLRQTSHISQKIINTARKIGQGSRERLQIGDISVSKEWAFAEDIARGILTLTDQEKVFEAVIGTGQAYSIEDWLELCFKALDLNWKDHVDVIPGFSPEYRCLVSNPETIRSLGWNPSVSFEELAQIMLAGSSNL